MIEDSVNGIKAATAAGMPTAAIPNRVTSCCDFSLANHVLASAHEFPGLIANLLTEPAE